MNHFRNGDIGMTTADSTKEVPQKLIGELIAFLNEKKLWHEARANWAFSQGAYAAEMDEVETINKLMAGLND